MFIAFPGFVIFLIIAILCGAAAAAVFFIFRYKGKGTRPSKNEILAEGIQQNLDDFSGMFEPVFSVAMGKNKKQEEVFTAWNAKVQDSAEDNGYKAIFIEKFGDYATWGQGKKKFNQKKADKIYQKKAKKLVKLFDKANILRGFEIFETGTEITAERYTYAGENSIETDAVYEVLAPCWTYGEKIVDKGVIR